MMFAHSSQRSRSGNVGLKARTASPLRSSCNHIEVASVSPKRLRLENEVNVMRKFIAFILLILVSHALSEAQGPDLIQHFDYDQKAPLNLKQIGVQRRATATVYDITYDS